MKMKCLAAFLFAGVLVPAAHAAEFKFGSRTLRVPDGFEVEMIAGPPLVTRPVEADFDEDGRLYVSDSSGSNEAPAKQLETKPHRILRLEDADGDGKFDRSTVFADQMMFPEGVMWKDGAVYIGAPPSIWKLTDTMGNGMADKREEWFQGRTLTGCANDLHGPYAGPDGWIYWCKGAFAKQTYDRPGQEPFVTRAAHIFRCRPDGTGIEAVMTGGMDNPVEVVFTSTGERIFSCTFLQNASGGKRDGLIHDVYGGVYGKIHDVIDEHPRTGDILPPMTHLGPAAPCGLARYESDVFGAEYRDNLFVCCFNLRKVAREVLSPDGATFKTQESDFLTCDDPDFHPTDVLEDADGSLIVLNTGGWYKICCPTSQLAKPDVLGEIYRIRKTGAAKVDDPRGAKISWEKQSPTELVQLLDDKRPVARKRAIEGLATRGAAAVSALAAASKKAVSAEARRNALWALSQIPGADARKATRAALTDKDGTVRHVALASISLWRDREAFRGVVPLLGDPDLQVRRIAAEALGRIGNPDAVAALLSAASRPEAADRMLEHSLIYAMIEIANHERTVPGLTSANARTHRATLIALDQMRDGRLDPGAVAPLLVSNDPLLKETARWITLRHHDWGGALAGFFRERLGGTEPEAGDRADMGSQLGQLAGDVAIQELLGETATNSISASWARSVSMDAISRANLKPAPEGWIHAVAEALKSPDDPQLREAIGAARGLNLPKTGNAGLTAALTKIGENTSVEADTRLEALAADQPLRKPSHELFAFLLENASAAKPWATRNNAVQVLEKAKLDNKELLNLAEAIRTAGPLDLARLLEAFEGVKDEVVGGKLVASLQAAKALSSLRIETLKPKLAGFPPSVKQSAEKLYEAMNTDAAAQKAHLEDVLAHLPAGDIRRGQAVFNSPKALCSSCHSMGYLGGHVGPDLTSVGTIRTERDLLESILYPSASFVRSFEPMRVMTKGGDDYSGILKNDAADEVVLLTGPNAEVHVARGDITEMRPGTVSIMPQGLEQQMSQQELADLVTFLKNTKWGAR